MLKIVQAPNPVLLQEAQPVKKFDGNLTKLIEEMTLALENAKDPEGVGLAAPQVGKSLQLFIVKESPQADIQVFINPKVEFLTPPTKEKPKKKGKGVKLEGCLSLKDIWGVVERSPKVKISYQDEEGTHHERIETGFFATILQHEFDHIQGILFTTRVLEQKEKLYHSSKDEDGEVVFEELSI